MIGEGHARPEVILESEALDITFEPGDADHAIVSFTGFGLRFGGLQTAEFRRSLGRTAPTFYVIDKARSWYNATLALAVETLVAELAARDLRRVVTLGSSMGGFRAMLFTELLPGAVRSLAFVPQSSVCPAIVPWETRWQKWVDAIAEWTVPDLLPRLGRVPHRVVFGCDEPFDVCHAARLAQAPNVTLHAVPGCGHDVTAVMKQRGELPGLLAALTAPYGAVLRRIHGTSAWLFPNWLFPSRKSGAPYG